MRVMIYVDSNDAAATHVEVAEDGELEPLPDLRIVSFQIGHGPAGSIERVLRANVRPPRPRVEEPSK